MKDLLCINLELALSVMPTASFKERDPLVFWASDPPKAVLVWSSSKIRCAFISSDLASVC